MRKPEQAPSLGELMAEYRKEIIEAYDSSAYQGVVSQCQRSYRHWDKMRFIAREREDEAGRALDPKIVWAHVLLGRMSQKRDTPFRGVDGEAVTYSVPSQVQRELMMIDRGLAGRLLSDDSAPLPANQRERFIVNSLREEAIASSMLEGAATTRRQAKEMLRKGRKPRTRGETMVLNNYQAIDFVRTHQRTPMTVDFLLELQEMLTVGTLEDSTQVGRLRRDEDQVVIADALGEELFVPPRASELPERLSRLCEFANSDAGEFTHPVLKACLMHFQLGVDHPFCDGNGRTARAVFYWMMLRAGYWMFEYLPISRLIYAGPAQYGRAFLCTETDEYDATYFLLYKMKIVERARRDLRNYLQHRQVEARSARRVFVSDRSLNHRQREVLLKSLQDSDSLFTIAGHQAVHGVSYGTARADLLRLVEKGYLDQSKVGKAYEFTPSEKITETIEK